MYEGQNRGVGLIEFCVIDQGCCYEILIGRQTDAMYISISCIVRQDRPHQAVSPSVWDKPLVELCLGFPCPYDIRHKRPEV